MANKCSQLFAKIDTLRKKCWPIVCSDYYNFDLQRFRRAPFGMDTEKYTRILKFLLAEGMLSYEKIIEPDELSREQLLEFHTAEYLNSLRDPEAISRMIGIPEIRTYPMVLIEPLLLHNLRMQASGTILAAKLALDEGAAINLGGGFHHCSASLGKGFSLFADISGALKTLHYKRLISRALIVDLDVHQGNGHERDFYAADWVQTLDVFNTEIYPKDEAALEKVNLTQVRLHCNISDEEYLTKVQCGLRKVLRDPCKPDIMVYVSGTNCMVDDPLGLMCVTPQGIIRRDELLFETASSLGIPIVMVLGGGYEVKTAKTVADSILNLRAKGYIRQLRNVGVTGDEEDPSTSAD